MTAATAPEPAATRTRRMQALDGLRGVAITLVVLSHGWTLWPMERVRDTPLAGLFRSGNLAVTIFFVIGGYLLVRSLLGEVDRTGRLDVLGAAGRRFIRVSAHVYALLLLLLVVHGLDESDGRTYPGTDLVTSVYRVATYTWNWYLRAHALEARPDLGHLWYISVYMQVTMLLIAVVWALRKNRVVLVGVLGALTAVLIPFRFYLVDAEGVINALVRTSGRMDAMVWGALAAAAMPWIQARVRARARYLLPGSIVVLVLVLFTTGHDESYFRWPGLAINLAAVAFVLSVILSDGNPALLRPLEWAPLLTLGRASMAIFVWHYPVFWAVARHSAEWSWPLRAGVALGITALLVVISQRVVEEPLQRWLEARRGAERAGPRPVAPDPDLLPDQTPDQTPDERAELPSGDPAQPSSGGDTVTVELSPDMAHAPLADSSAGPPTDPQAQAEPRD